MTIFRNVSERRKIERELRESEQKFRSIFDHAMDGILLWDREHRIIDANPIACDIFAAAKEQLLGRTVGECVPDRARRQLNKLLAQCERAGEASGEVEFSDEWKGRMVEFSLKKK